MVSNVRINDVVILLVNIISQNMLLARYPNIDTKTGLWQWLSVGNIIDKQKTFTFDSNRYKNKALLLHQLYVSISALSSTVSNRILSWKNTSTLWLHGYWSYDWADNYVQVVEISPNNATYTVSETTPPLYGYLMAKHVFFSLMQYM